MPWSSEASVVHYGGRDYWRTWFLQECEASQLFGINENHLPLITAAPTQGGYQEGTEVFLEDAPYYHATQTLHRVCGPYRVAAVEMPRGAQAIYQSNGKIIVYKDPHPERGPWFDAQRVKRSIDGVGTTFAKIASEFGYYPYRFKIVRSPNYAVRHVRHERDCWLCVTRRRRRY